MRKVGFLLLLGNVMWFAACGSGGGASNTVTSISVTCSPSSVGPGGTSQCSAFVSGTGNFSSGVTWSASAGSISTSGLLTAPSSPQTVTVTATSTQNTSVSGTANVSVTTTSSNVAPMIVDAEPAPSSFTSVNVAFVTVTVCVAGTTTCQSIDHVEVDTGSEGLRLLSSASGGELNISLAPETVGGNPVDECLVFADGYVWGPGGHSRRHGCRRIRFQCSGSVDDTRLQFSGRSQQLLKPEPLGRKWQRGRERDGIWRQWHHRRGGVRERLRGVLRLQWGQL